MKRPAFSKRVSNFHRYVALNSSQTRRRQQSSWEAKPPQEAKEDLLISAPDSDITKYTDIAKK